MVNIIIYLENEMRTKATQLGHDLMKSEFVASASIDEDNSYFIQKKEKVEKNYTHLDYSSNKIIDVYRNC